MRNLIYIYIIVSILYYNKIIIFNNEKNFIVKGKVVNYFKICNNIKLTKYNMTEKL